MKIGLVAPFEGRYRYVGYDVFAAVRLALREVNAAGGVGGYAVELVAYDDGADPQMAVLQARKLAVDPAVALVIGHWREETTLAALPAYAEAGLPVVAAGVVKPPSASWDGVVVWPGPEAAALAASLLDAAGSGGVALVSDGSVLGQGLAAQGSRLALTVSPDDPGWLAEALAVGPAVVLCAADPVTAGEVVAALRAAGWQGAFLGGPELAAADFAAVGGAAADGARFVTPWPFPQDVADGGWIAAYEEVSGGAPAGPLALPAYQATQLALAALRADVAANGQPSRSGAALAAQRVEETVFYWYTVGEGR